MKLTIYNKKMSSFFNNKHFIELRKVYYFYKKI